MRFKIVQTTLRFSGVGRRAGVEFAQVALAHWVLPHVWGKAEEELTLEHGLFVITLKLVLRQFY